MLKRLTMILLCVLRSPSWYRPRMHRPRKRPQPPSHHRRAPRRRSRQHPHRLTILDQRSDTAGTPKTVTMVIEDQQSSRIRPDEEHESQRRWTAEILRGSHPRRPGPQCGPQEAPIAALRYPAGVHHGLLEDGKPLVAVAVRRSGGRSQGAAEVKATIVR